MAKQGEGAPRISEQPHDRISLSPVPHVPGALGTSTRRGFDKPLQN
ncbi:MAG: hypothetical protein AVDCRST_MAG03-3445 [uncultured Rubrobacteraceae bacterium]|uniref:Uncharacterized protein n=1 Tax=uncultured Rubrobacteraceae bacterium TaxID=349277 RepID=A0A6J4Q5D1_9ACTN|nr:MAG: hypothetical protein AVDCRST_MAG03-3445 [uncultured Rubrobacteraceae bacterium]